MAGGPAVVPPSTGNTIPVICAARSLARNRTAFATSIGGPSRWSGCMSRMISPTSYDVLMLVAMWAGAMQLTRMPCSARSIAIDRLNWMTAAFDAR